jgi:hypothetical protein
VAARTAEKNRVEKLLEDAGIPMSGCRCQLARSAGIYAFVA